MCQYRVLETLSIDINWDYIGTAIVRTSSSAVAERPRKT